MRIFALSDVHVDYDANAQWISGLSSVDYVDDVLILAGDVSDSLAQLDRTLETLARRFRQVLFVPGNHDVWVIRDQPNLTSFEKFEQVCVVAERCGASMKPFSREGVGIVPLLGWYDYSFGLPSSRLGDFWMDYHACRWPSDYEMHDVARHFDQANPQSVPRQDLLISFSHFLPRIDLLHHRGPFDPVLGSTRLDEQVRVLKSQIHVYGHSHVNRRVQIDGVTYVNNAFGYPRESGIAAKQLLCIHST
jgi:predicted phosphodiesterase